MAESWFALSAEDQKEALAVAAAESGWPAYLLEKDIWVVWALQILGTDQQLLQSLTFKCGTSLSKAHGLIERFSEDVDLTLNIQHLWPEVDLSAAANPTQAQTRRKVADRKLKQWVQEIPLPLLQLLLHLLLLQHLPRKKKPKRLIPKSHPPAIKKPKLLRSNPLRFSLIRLRGVDPTLLTVDDEALCCAYRRVKIVQDQPDQDDDELSDHVSIRLQLARYLAIKRYQEVWG